MIRTRYDRLATSLLISALLAFNVGPAIADAVDEDMAGEVEIPMDDSAEEGEEGEEGEDDAPEHMRSLSDVRWKPNEMPATLFLGPIWGAAGIERAPVGLNRMADLLILRPLTVGLGMVGASMYVLAAVPTLVSAPDKHAQLQDDLLFSPWRFIRDRPLGERMPGTDEDDETLEADQAD